MSKIDKLQQALKDSSGKPGPAPTPHASASVPRPMPAAASVASGNADSQHSRYTRPPHRQGKENISAWLDSDFGTSLRMVHLKHRKDAQGNKLYLADLIAEALNDLFVKYNVPTVNHK